MSRLTGLCLLLGSASATAMAHDAPPASVQFAGQRWVVEAEQPASTHIRAQAHRLQLQASKGLTLWLATPLQPPYEISYQREVRPEADPALRISDMNQFWAARLDLAANGQLFRRSGSFASYNDLDLFYFGIGGNSNTTSRFRHYDGHGRRPLITEYLDGPHLLQTGHVYHIRTQVLAQATRVYVDGKLWFQSSGQTISAGYFGLRLTGASQQISHFQVSPLP